jgi:hypothetical protein
MESVGTRHIRLRHLLLRHELTKIHLTMEAGMDQSQHGGSGPYSLFRLGFR